MGHPVPSELARVPLNDFLGTAGCPTLAPCCSALGWVVNYRSGTVSSPPSLRSSAKVGTDPPTRQCCSPTRRSAGDLLRPEFGHRFLDLPARAGSEVASLVGLRHRLEEQLAVASLVVFHLRLHPGGRALLQLRVADQQ